MKSYTVHEPSGMSTRDFEKADQIEFVREGFSWLALLFPIPWLLYHRMWIGLAIFFGIFFAINMIAVALGASDELIGIMSFLLNLVMGFEAQNFRRWSLEQSGYQYRATVSGNSRDECELKFFSHWLENERSATNLTRLAAQTMGQGQYPGLYTK